MKRTDVAIMFKMLNHHLKNKLNIKFIINNYPKDKLSNGYINMNERVVYCNWPKLSRCNYNRTLHFLLHEIGHDLHREFILKTVDEMVNKADTTKMTNAIMETHNIDQGVAVMSDDIKEIGKFVKNEWNYEHRERTATEIGLNFYSTTFLKGGIII